MTNTPRTILFADVEVGDHIRIEGYGETHEFTVVNARGPYIESMRNTFHDDGDWVLTLLNRALPPLPEKMGRYRAGVSYEGFHRFFMLDKRGTWWDIGNEHTPFMREEEAESVAKYGPLVPLVVSDG